MKYLIIILSLLIAEKRLVSDGFKLAWEFQGDQLVISLTAPTTGWVAVGFTENRSIINTNLIQGAVRNGKTFLEDQYVTAVGRHPTIESLGGKSKVYLIDGFEKEGRTTITFLIQSTSEDRFHCDLVEGEKINVWLAYSVSDDFDHHSRKRVLKQIRL